MQLPTFAKPRATIDISLDPIKITYRRPWDIREFSLRITLEVSEKYADPKFAREDRASALLRRLIDPYPPLRWQTGPRGIEREPGALTARASIFEDPTPALISHLRAELRSAGYEVELAGQEERERRARQDAEYEARVAQEAKALEDARIFFGVFKTSPPQEIDTALRLKKLVCPPEEAAALQQTYKLLLAHAPRPPRRRRAS